jgi:heme o synthase
MEVSQITIATRRTRIADFLELTKPGITFMVLITTLVGFYLGAGNSISLLLLFHTILGTAFIASGASALNQYIERDLDARMLRTRGRPLPDGRVLPNDALIFAIALSVAGTSYLALFVNLLTGILGFLTLAAYIFVYTPLKTRTTLCTLIGAIPGAAPPVMGWTGATGTIDPTAVALFGILFLWQMPHFFSISWIYTEDYLRGGFVVHRSGESTGRQIVLFCCALIPVSLLPSLFGVTGTIYIVGAMVLGFMYLGYGFALSLFRSNTYARRLLRMSFLYLPALMALMMLDKIQ